MSKTFVSQKLNYSEDVNLSEYVGQNYVTQNLYVCNEYHTKSNKDQSQ